MEMVPVSDAGLQRRGQCHDSATAAEAVRRTRIARAARRALARRAMCDFSAGVVVWLGMVLASLLCLLGLVGCHESICRRVRAIAVMRKDDQHLSTLMQHACQCTRRCHCATKARLVIEIMSITRLRIADRYRGC